MVARDAWTTILRVASRDWPVEQDLAKRASVAVWARSVGDLAMADAMRVGQLTVAVEPLPDGYDPDVAPRPASDALIVWAERADPLNPDRVSTTEHAFVIPAGGGYVDELRAIREQLDGMSIVPRYIYESAVRDLNYEILAREREVR